MEAQSHLGIQKLWVPVHPEYYISILCVKVEKQLTWTCACTVTSIFALLAFSSRSASCSHLDATRPCCTPHSALNTSCICELKRGSRWASRDRSVVARGMYREDVEACGIVEAG